MPNLEELSNKLDAEIVKKNNEEEFNKKQEEDKIKRGKKEERTHLKKILSWVIIIFGGFLSFHYLWWVLKIHFLDFDSKKIAEPVYRFS